MADKVPNLSKKPSRHLYDDEKLENMLHYYKIEDNYESLLRYIKNRGLVDDEEEE